MRRCFLSPRQLEVLDAIRQGETSPMVARRLKISPRTVDQYVADSCTRLEVRNRTQAVAKAMQQGLIGQPDRL